MGTWYLVFAEVPHVSMISAFTDSGLRIYPPVSGQEMC